MNERVLPVLLLAGFVVVIFAAIWFGWRNRQRRQSHVVAPRQDADLGPLTRSAEGLYVVTTTSGDWLDRIAVHSLGVRSKATFEVHANGVRITRPGLPDIAIGTREIVSVSNTSGMAGKFVERGGLLVITWMLGDLEVDTGFRTRHIAEQAELIEALTALPGVELSETATGVPAPRSNRVTETEDPDHTPRPTEDNA